MRGVTAEVMAEIDARAQEEYGIPQEALMEEAGKTVFQHVSFDMKRFGYKRVCVFCGKGNNGGDGFVSARYFFNEDTESVTVYASDAKNMREGAAKENYKRALEAGIAIKKLEDLSNDDILPGTVFIDAFFGTGFSGDIKGLYKEAIDVMNSSPGFTYAVDIPSGLNGTTGESSKTSVRASKTITFGLPKAGFFTGDGPRLTGEVIVEGIGFPEKLLTEYS